MAKQYDRAYFDRWYRSPRAAVRPEVIRRKARLALAAAEHLLGRDARTVLDIGCGEGQWRSVLRRIRPKLRYTGVDPSEYVVRRYGRRRNILHGGLESLDTLRLATRYDLIVCSDVLQYISLPVMRRGLRAIEQRLGGVAYIEAYTIDDDMAGDFRDWHHRTAAQYHRELRRARLLACGLHCYIPARLRHVVNELELA